MIAHWSGSRNERWSRWACARYVTGDLGALPLGEVSGFRIAQFSKLLSDRPYLHNRVIALLRTAWGFGVAWGLCAGDPFASVRFAREAPRTRALDSEERALFERARLELESGAQRSTTRRACRAFRLSLLSAMRPGEAYSLRRDAINWKRGTATLIEHKTAAKTGPRTVPLGKQALKLLVETPPVGDSPFFFPGRRSDKPLSNPRATFRLICERAGLKDVQPRDLRRTWGTEAINKGFSLKGISLQLGHTTTRTTERHYAHLLLETQRNVVDQLGETL